jgi:hypothetical protein
MRKKITAICMKSTMKTLTSKQTPFSFYQQEILHSLDKHPSKEYISGMEDALSCVEKTATRFKPWL